VNGIKTLGPYLPPARIIRVEFQWSYQSQNFFQLAGVRYQNGRTRNVNEVVARLYQFAGRGVICWGSNINDPETGEAFLYASGSSGWSYQQVGTVNQFGEPVETIDMSESNSGREAFYMRRRWNPNDPNGIAGYVSAGILRGSTPNPINEPDYEMRYDQWTPSNHGPFTDIRDTCQSSENINQPIIKSGRTIGSLMSLYNYRYSDSPVNGYSIGTQEYSKKQEETVEGLYPFRGFVKDESKGNWALSWRRTLLTCTTGGDPTGSLIGEPDCSNCGDASMLEPLA
jgi:hypothetical protein